ncbi:hypothetical protein C823_001566 [Eubacterium plexicaudatum ASF492]|uniref:PemK-like protein n=1 Tax=Eubacterium plexicaudatum ASF492 TaxID=1235802 RepID=N2B7H7_9FIRM|nr:hypothetical protein C823_001566 [Eubacterium plexicaudatum ASF492]
MIGKIYWVIFKYYDNVKHSMSFKKRPVLIIGEADRKDYVVLPISRVTRKEHLDMRYDFEMQGKDYPALLLKATSYVRTHKQTVVNIGELAECIADFREEYPEAYISVMALVEEFQKELINKAF